MAATTNEAKKLSRPPHRLMSAHGRFTLDCGLTKQDAGTAGSCQQRTKCTAANSVPTFPTSTIRGTRIVNVEPRPGSLSTVDVAAHHLAEALADRESKAGAAVFASGGGIGLGEFLK